MRSNGNNEFAFIWFIAFAVVSLTITLGALAEQLGIVPVLAFVAVVSGFGLWVARMLP